MNSQTFSFHELQILIEYIDNNIFEKNALKETRTMKNSNPISASYLVLKV